jgi:hypothetical protein
MHPNAERVRDALAAAGARADLVEFPEGTCTSADAAAAIGTTIAQIAKTLVFWPTANPSSSSRPVPTGSRSSAWASTSARPSPARTPTPSAGPPAFPSAGFRRWATPAELIRVTGGEVVEVRA